jgi:hypothetical protein
MKRKSSNRHSDLEDKDIKKELRKARNRMSAMAHREKKEAFESEFPATTTSSTGIKWRARAGKVRVQLVPKKLALVQYRFSLASH